MCSAYSAFRPRFSVTTSPQGRSPGGPPRVRFWHPHTNTSTSHGSDWQSQRLSAWFLKSNNCFSFFINILLHFFLQILIFIFSLNTSAHDMYLCACAGVCVFVSANGIFFLFRFRAGNKTIEETTTPITSTPLITTTTSTPLITTTTTTPKVTTQAATPSPSCNTTGHCWYLMMCKI